MHHFHMLDVRGTIRATIKSPPAEDPDKDKILNPLGIASRYQFDLEDFESDIAAGYVNISKEEYNHFGLTQKDLHNISAPNIKNWFRHRAEEGMTLLEEYHRRLPEGNFSLLARTTFPLVYEFPASKVFRQVLSEK